MNPAILKPLLAKENVVAVGLGKKIIRGQQTNIDAIIVFVKKKLPPADLTDPVPPIVPSPDGDLPSDVIEVGEISATRWGDVKSLETVTRFRPARGGASIGHFKITAGTLGVVAKKDGLLVALSNNHVLANSNQGRAGDAIYQPGPYDGGQASDEIAKLLSSVPLNFNDTPNDVDAAVAMPVEQSNLALGIMTTTESDVVVPTGFYKFVAGDAAWKRGRTTDYTQLRCIATDASVQVQYGAGQVALFQGCDIFDPAGASAGGDSGSVIMFGDKLGSHLFAGSDRVTVGASIEKAYSLLGLEIALPLPPPEEPDEPDDDDDEPLPDEPIEPVELLAVYLDGKVQVRATISVEDGKIVVK